MSAERRSERRVSSPALRLRDDRDTLARRRRITPISTGKRVTAQERDLLWFQKLQQHGPLPSSYLLAYTKHLLRSEKRAKERLTDLFNEDDTLHGGRYLERPPQQFRTLDSRYNQLVYDLAPAAKRALRDAGRGQDVVTAASGPWLHRHMVACVTASIELATIERPDLTFIPQRAILARAGGALGYPVRISEPATGQNVIKKLIPDALFGLEYQTAAGSRFRFLFVECDRATEPASSANFNRKSWLRSLRQHAAYVGAGRYREHLQLTAPLLVLNITSDAARMAKLITVTEQLSGAVSYQLFQTWEAFGPIWRPPQPNERLPDAACRRVGCEAFRIDRA
ncbi:MAG: replication-relaxation family protein [Pseudomonadota bacterium]